MSARRMIWRWNLRMLRREWRQLAVIAALIAVSVGFGVAAVLTAFNLTPPPERTYGGGAALATTTGDATEQRAAFEQRFEPIGVIESATVAVPGSIDRLDLRVQSPEDTVAAPLIALVDGRWPDRAEAAVTSGVAARFDVSIGGTIELAGQRLPVVGLVENPTDLDDEFALLWSFDGLDIEPASVTSSFLIDAPISEIEAASVGPIGVDDPGEGVPSLRTLAALAMSVVVAIAMLQVALLAGVGFAVLGRRRSRQYGLLAATGATPRQIEQAAAASGLVTGVVGSAIGLGLGLTVVVIAVQGMEELVRHRIDLMLPWWGIVPGVLLGIGAATISAWWPSRALSRQSIVEILAAGRPARRSIRRSTVIGAGVSVAGVLALLVGVGRESIGLSVPGVIASFLGTLLLAPAVVQFVGWQSTGMPLASRIAGRAIARQQGRSAAVIAAVAVALGIAMGLATVTAAIDQRAASRPGNLPDNIAIAWLDTTPEGSFVVPAAVDPDVIRRTAEQLAEQSPDLAVVPIEVAVRPDAERITTPFVRAGTAAGVVPELVLRPADPAADEVLGFGDVDAAGNEVVFTGHLLWVATLEMLRAWELPGLPVDEVLVLAPWPDAVLLGERETPPAGYTPLRIEPGLPAFTSAARTFITPAAVEAGGMQRVTVGWLLIGEGAFSDTARNGLRESVQGLVVTEFRDPASSTGWVRTVGVLAAAAVGLVILIAAVGLARMESVSDMRLLATIGATDRTRRSIAASTAVLLGLAGVALAIPIGFLPQVAMVVQADGDFSFTVPWVQLLLVVVLFPLLGGLVALPGSTGLEIDRAAGRHRPDR